MWNHCIRRALILLTLSFLAGCIGGSNGPKQNPAPDTPNWPELKQLSSQDLLRPIFFAIEAKDASALKKALSASSFTGEVDKFANSKIPSGYDSTERKAAQNEAVTKLRKAIELANSSGSLKDLTDNYNAGMKSLADAGAARATKK